MSKFIKKFVLLQKYKQIRGMPANLYPVSEIQQIIGANGVITKNYNISNLVTDSRRISAPVEALFFALNGRRSGHEFITEAYAQGVRNFVVKQAPEPVFTDANFLVTPDVLAALQTLAAYHRSRFNLEVMGITGSNGKTVVKEWLYQLMAPDKNIVRNPKSYNSQIGVPLSIWQIDFQNDLGIFEAGISTVDEMSRLEAIIQPTIGVLTHIGTAHDEGFKNRDEKIIEKLGLFKNCRLVIHNYDQLVGFQNFILAENRFTWSKKIKEADLYVFAETEIAKRTYMRARFNGGEIECLIPFTDAASIENAIICWATLLALGYHDNVSERIERLNAVSMRLELKTGINGCSIIDDSYNSDVQSLEIALNFLNQQNQHAKRTLILSDIFQSGLDQDTLYFQIAELVKNKKINKFVGVGSALLAHQELFDTPEKHFYPDTQTLLKHLRSLNFSNETVLIKGSRSFEFELVSRALVQKAHETVLEINLNALLSNLNFYRSKLKQGVKVMAMVKAFSYGSGTFEVANILQYNNVDYLAVAYIDEGVTLRRGGITLPIMVLNPEASAFDKLTEYKLEPVIYSFGLLNDFVKYAKDNAISNYPVHCKTDTGMHRLGFEDSEIELLCILLKQTGQVRIQSIFSHLAASDAAVHDDFTLLQINRFDKVVSLIEKTLGYRVIKHLSNTAGISRWPQAQYDMVRLGIGLYGIDAATSPSDTGLQPVASLKTSVAQVKTISGGETISYNRSGSLTKDGKIATVRVGYADGYVRAFGNGVGKMMVKGVMVPTVGNITMDMCMLDVTDLDVSEGDEVVVFNEKQRIEDLAKQIGTIPYEILTNVSQRVKRVYFYE